MLRRVFKAFHYRDFRLQWIGACTSSIGTWMQRMAQSWLVLELSKSPSMLGLDAFLGELPIVLFSLYGGVIADRVDRRPLLLLLASGLLGGAVRGSCEEGPGQTEWKTTTSPHFLVYHEAPFAPPGVVLGLEKLYGRLRLDLSMFAPWMEKEKVKVYIYRSRNTYLNPKEFNPPSWSDGIAFLDRKIIVSFEQKGRRKLTEILAHEMTHLLFESYWEEARREPQPGRQARRDGGGLARRI